MGVDYCIKQDDRWPYIKIQATDADDQAINLTTASTAIFRAVKMDYSATITGGATITDSTAGSIEYQWGTASGAYPSVAGDYKGEFAVTFSDGSTARVPNNTYITIRVLSKVL